MPKITFKNPQGKTSLPITIEVKKGTSVLEASELLEPEARVGHACGGNLGCSTCHVYVEAGLESLDEPKDKEYDIMDKLARDVQPDSRLGCQCRIADEDLVVVISDEGLRAWLDENPDERAKAYAAKQAEQATKTSTTSP
ncbi:MAG TPA: 2Fe-2S iron-sulfur cluster-binding protein [Kofleriaceae bacterium]|jgi:2Fe-2S ferredoxin